MSQGKIFIVGERRKVFNNVEIIETVWNSTLEDHHVQWSNTEEMFFKEMLQGNDNVVFLTADEFEKEQFTPADTAFYWVSCANTEFTTSAIWAYFISDSAKRSLRDGKMRVLVTQTLEPWPNVFTTQNESVVRDQLNNFYHDLSKILGHSVKIKVLIGNTFQFPPSNKMSTSGEITLHYYPFWEYYSQRVYSKKDNEAHTLYSAPSIVDALANSERDYLCLNHFPRLHRPLTVHALDMTGNLDRGHVTMNVVPDYDGAILSSCAKFPHSPMKKSMFGDGQFGKRLLAEAMNNPIREPMTFPEKNAAQNIARWSVDDDLLKSTWLSVTTEAYDASGKFNFENSLIFPTEKIFRDIYLKRPFMVVGPRGFLVELAKMGYATFNYFWDESYDLQQSLADRIEGVTGNLHLLSKIKKKIKDNPVHMDTILQHNYDLFINKDHGQKMFSLLKTL